MRLQRMRDDEARVRAAWVRWQHRLPRGFITLSGVRGTQGTLGTQGTRHLDNGRQIRRVCPDRGEIAPPFSALFHVTWRVSVYPCHEQLNVKGIHSRLTKKLYSDQDPKPVDDNNPYIELEQRRSNTWQLSKGSVCSELTSFHYFCINVWFATFIDS